jgi:hypothetical protein
MNDTDSIPDRLERGWIHDPTYPVPLDPLVAAWHDYSEEEGHVIHAVNRNCLESGISWRLCMERGPARTFFHVNIHWIVDLPWPTSSPTSAPSAAGATDVRLAAAVATALGLLIIMATIITSKLDFTTFGMK